MATYISSVHYFFSGGGKFHHMNFQCKYHFISLHRIKKDLESITNEALGSLVLLCSHSALIFGILLCNIIVSFIGSLMSSSFEDNIAV